MTHQPEDDPGVCAAAALHELADADLTGEVRAEVLEHGMRAVAELRRQRDEARRWARQLAWEDGDPYKRRREPEPEWLAAPETKQPPP